MTKNTNKKYSVAIRIALAFYILSVLFEIMRWEAGAAFALFPAIAVTLLYLLRYQAKEDKVKLDHTKLFIVLFWFAGIAWAYEVPYVRQIFYLSWISLSLFVLYTLLKQNKLVSLIQLNLIALSSIPVIALGLLFKILHWPFNHIFLVSGFALLSLGVIIDGFRNSKRPKSN